MLNKRRHSYKWVEVWFTCLLLLLPFLMLPLGVYAQTPYPYPSISADRREVSVNHGETFTVTFTARNLGGTPNDRGWSHATISVSGGLEIVGWTRWSNRDKKFNIGDPIWYADGRQIPAQNEMIETYAYFPSGTTRNLTVTFRAKSPGNQWINFRFTLVNFTQDEDWSTARYYRDPPSSSIVDQQGWPVKRIDVSVQVPSPDLTVPSVSFSPSVVVAGNGSVTISWVEKNQGSGNAGAYRVGVYLGVSEYGRDYLLGSIYREGLAAGASRSYTQAFPIPSNVPPRNYYVTVFIDDTRIVSESNENNNIGSSTPNRITVQAPPTTGNLQVNVHNIEGRPITWSGTVTVVLYDSNYVEVTSKSESFSPGVSYVRVVFTGLQAGTYIIEVYQTPNSGLRLREFWGANTGVEVRPGETRTFEFYRHTQVVWGVRFEGLDLQEQLPLGRSTTPKVTVRNYETFPKETKVRLIIDRDGSPPYDYDRTVDTPVLIPGGATAEFTLPSFTPTEPGIYNYYAIALGKYGPAGGNFITTHQYFWTRAFVVPAPSFDFSISASPTHIRVVSGTASQDITVTINLVAGSSQRVDLSLSGLPSDVGTYAFSPHYGNPTFNSTLRIETYGNAPTGSYTLTIIGVGGGITRSTQIVLEVVERVTLSVDVWTNKGGQGRGNLDGGQYNIGESITLHCSVNINVDSLRIRVIRPDGVVVTALERGPLPAGTYIASGTVGESPGERRVICEASSGGQSSSDEVRFIVVAPSDTTPPTVRVIAPNGGETLRPGNVFRIRWEASDNVGVERVHIWLFQGDTQVMVVARNLPNTGHYNWTVPDRPGGNYRIRIAAVDAAGNAAHDDSDGAFEIIPIIDVTAEVIASNLRLSVGEEGFSRIILSRAPTGIAGYEIIVRLIGEVADIVDVRFPDWAGLRDKSISNYQARLKAVDIQDRIQVGSEEIVLAEVVFRGKAEGEARIEIEVVRMDDDRGESIPVTIRNGVLEVVAAGPPPVEPGLPPPRDLDGDGLYEDINGNGRLDFDDVVKFFQHFDEPVISQYPRYYDFNRNERLDYDDIVELFRRVGG